MRSGKHVAAHWSPEWSYCLALQQSSQRSILSLASPKFSKKTSQLSANIRPHHIAQGALSAVTAMLSPSGQSSAPPEIFGLWRISTWNGSKIGVPISNGPAKFIKIGHCLSYSKHNFWELAISIIPPIWPGYHFAPPDRFRSLASGEAVSHRNKFGKYLQTSFQLQQRKTSKF